MQNSAKSNTYLINTVIEGEIYHRESQSGYRNSYCRNLAPSLSRDNCKYDSKATQEYCECDLADEPEVMGD